VNAYSHAVKINAEELEKEVRLHTGHDADVLTTASWSSITQRKQLRTGTTSSAPVHRTAIQEHRHCDKKLARLLFDFVVVNTAHGEHAT